VARSLERWLSPARRKPEGKLIKGKSYSGVAGQVHGHVRKDLRGYFDID